MKTFLIAALAIAVGILCLAPSTPKDDELIVDYYKDRAVLSEVCLLIKEDCSQIEAPTVVITRLVPKKYYGMYYPGERYIFISYGAIKTKPYRDIEIHETTHYILHEKYGVEYGFCKSERMARSVTAILTDTEVDPKWEENYGCKPKRD